MVRWSFVFTALLASAAMMAHAESELPAASMVFRSTGQALVDNTGWCLQKHGFLGSFIDMPAKGKLRLSVVAANGTPEQSTQMVVVVGLSRKSFDVKSGQFKPYTVTMNLPRGLHALRIELHSASDNSDLWVQALSVQGGSIVNVADKTTVMRCADDAIRNYRKADIRLRITDAYGNPMANTSVRLQTKRLAFKLGTAVSGMWITEGGYLKPDLPAGSNEKKIADFIVQNFNMVEPENAGKWIANEQERGKPDCRMIDAIIDFAERNNMYVRMHGLLWGWPVAAMPAWTNELMNQAIKGDQQAKKEFMDAVDSRMEWWLKPRYSRYYEQDLLNEGIHESRFVQLYGKEGMADLWKKAVKMAPATRHAANEYGVVTNNEDRYANWYWQHIRDMKYVQGIGIQTHVNTMNDYNPVIIHQALQNLSWYNLPITQTEWSLGDYPTAQQAEEGMEILLKSFFGNPLGDGFQVWGFQKGHIWRTGYELCDENFKLTPLGKAWQSITQQWRNDITVRTDASGTVLVPDVWYADVSLSTGDKQTVLKVKRGVKQYTVQLR